MSAAALIIAAVILGASFQAAELTPFSWFGLTVIAILIRRGYFQIVPAYLAGVTFQMVGVFWMTSTYSSVDLTEARVSNWVLLGLYFGMIFPVALGLGVRLRARWPMWLVMPMIWTMGDLLRFESGRLIGGAYPWLALGYSQTGFVIGCQVADLGGVWGVGFLAAMFAGALADALYERRLPVLATVLIVAALGYGVSRIWTPEFSAGPTVALMAGADSDIPPADLALWPETAFDGHKLIAASCATVQGCLRHEGGNTFNSAMIDVDGVKICYDKCNLVPYSESRLTPGTQTVRFASGGYEIGVAICYDICFGRFMQRLGDCDFIVVVANESSDPTMQLASQLLAIAKIRAIEMRRAIVRNANGGYSGAVDGNGRTQPLEVEQATVVAVPVDRRLSLYVYLGDWLPVMCVLALAVEFVSRRARLQGVPKGASDVVHGSPASTAQSGGR